MDGWKEGGGVGRLGGQGSHPQPPISHKGGVFVLFKGRHNFICVFICVPLAFFHHHTTTTTMHSLSFVCVWRVGGWWRG